MTAPPAVQPLRQSGARYTVELARCVVFGVVACGVCAAGYFAVAGAASGRHRGLVVVLSVLVFPALYGVVGHQRGIGRALAALCRVHGGYLFDQTLGRFFAALELRRPGACAAALESSARLVQAFRLYLLERPAMPRTVRRVALRYVRRVGTQLDAGSLAREHVLVDGRVDAVALRHWTVTRMQGQFRPTWTAFVVVLAAQVVMTGALAWASQ